MKSRGSTLIEVMIAGSLFLLLTALLFAALGKASQAWSVGGGRTEMLTEAQVLFARLQPELESSAIASINVEPGILSFASSQGLQTSATPVGNEVQNDGSAFMRKYVVLYRNAAESEVYWAEQGISDTLPAYTVPQQITNVNLLGTGPEALSYFASGGRRVAKGIEDIRFSLDGRVLRVEMDVASETEQRASYQSTTFIRN